MTPDEAAAILRPALERLEREDLAELGPMRDEWIAIYTLLLAAQRALYAVEHGYLPEGPA